MSRMKILHIVTKGSPFGGAQKYIFDVVTHLPSDQFESVVLVGEGEELPDRLKNEIRNKKNGEEIRIIQIPELGRDINMVKEWNVFWQLVKIIRDEKPHIVHLNSSKIGILGTLAVRIVRLSFLFSPLKTTDYGLKTIFTAHGWSFNEPWRPTLAVWTIQFLSWITILLSDTTIVIAKSEMIQALHMPFTRNKIKLIYNGIEPIDFKTKKESREFLSEKIKEKTGSHIDTHDLWIGTIAELHTNKNIFESIRAFEMLGKRDARYEIRDTKKEGSDHISNLKSPISTAFIIVGEGEERKNLEDIIKENGLKEKVFLVGKIENASTYLKAFDIFALPSVKEGLPYTLLEAGLAGLPCLSTYVGGIPEIIRNNVSGVLVEPGAQEIAQGLQFLINNPDKRKEFGKALQEKVKNNFSLEKMIGETIKVYSL